MIFVNLPVSDLSRSVDFFSSLGFTFDERFTDESATCMVISDTIYAMLLVNARFTELSSRAVLDTADGSEVLIALSYDSRDEVDELCDRALAGGGTESHPPQDHGFMYQRSFQDPDGHVWEIFHMDMSAVEEG
jgi:predicted lactoylglutathione lyase